VANYIVAYQVRHGAARAAPGERVLSHGAAGGIRTALLQLGKLFVIRWGIGILSEYLIVIVVSFLLIMLLYELFIRRFGLARFFFGMRPKKNKSTAPVT
jgi:hypothetical protein